MEFKLFLIINPGLEDLALKEIKLKCPPVDFSTTKGGIEVSADLDWVVKAHTLLKIPTRILLRVINFKVKDFPKLHQKLIRLRWNSFLSHPRPSFEVSTTKSRLFHTDRIKETCEKALAEALKQQPLKKDWEKFNYPAQTIFIRIADDTLTLSLDLTGDSLYKRGVQKIKGEAPLRESLAAALLLDLFQDYHEKVDLIDPMCGSGTFLFEANFFHQPLHKRKFAFEYAPFFRGKRVVLPPMSEAFNINQLKGFDLNEDLLSKFENPGSIIFESLDSLKQPLFSQERPFFMICNPPYGERIKIKGSKGVFLKKIRDKFLFQDKPLRLGWLVPSDLDDLFTETMGYKIISKRKFRNGGLAVTFWVWEKLA